MAKKNETTTIEQTAEQTAKDAAAAGAALATTGGSALAAALDGIEIGDGGLGEVDNTDIKIAAKVWNFKGTDAAGDPIPPNTFYDTVQETTSKTLDLALLDLHKTREWREYDEAEGKSKVRCRSQSAAEDARGTMDDGTERACKGCPDAQWRNVDVNGKKKRTRNCGPVYNVTAVERGAGERAGEPSVLRFKRTSLPVIQAHLNKHHIGKLSLGGGRRANVPLYALAVRASLKMSDDKKYALPVLEVTGVLGNDEVRQNAENARFYREIVLPALDSLAAKDHDGADGAGGGDTSFNPGDFGGDDAPSRSPQNGDRFADDRAR